MLPFPHSLSADTGLGPSGAQGSCSWGTTMRETLADTTRVLSSEVHTVSLTLENHCSFPTDPEGFKNSTWSPLLKPGHSQGQSFS